MNGRITKASNKPAEKSAYPPAIERIKKSIELLSKEPKTAASISRILSHRYNLACCYAIQVPSEAQAVALMAEQLREIAVHEPWRVVRARKDEDFVHVLTHQVFVKVVKEAETRFERLQQTERAG